MEDKYSLKELLMYIIIVVLVLGLFYGITILVTNKKSNKKVDNTTSTSDTTKIDYLKVLAQNALSQKEDSYYVFAYTNEDTNVATYNNDLTSYKNKEDALKVYYVELDNAFNKNNYAEESNFEDGKIIFKTTTLLKVENGIIVEKYETNDDLTSALESLKGE